MTMENNGPSILPDYSFRSSMFPAVGDPINIFLPTIRSYLGDFAERLGSNYTVTRLDAAR